MAWWIDEWSVSGDAIANTEYWPRVVDTAAPLEDLDERLVAGASFPDSAHGSVFDHPGGGYIFMSAERRQAVEDKLTGIRLKSMATRRWLRFYLLDDSSVFELEKDELYHRWLAYGARRGHLTQEELAVEALIFTNRYPEWIHHHKPLAEWELARLKLCQEMILRPECVDFQEITASFSGEPSAATLWCFWNNTAMWMDLHELFTGENIAGEPEKRDRSKKAFLEDFQAKEERQVETLPQDFSPPPPHIQAQLSQPTTSAEYMALSLLAMRGTEERGLKIALEDPTFDQEHWKAYTRARRKYRNVIKRNKFIQLAWIGNDNRLINSRPAQQVSQSRKRR